MPRLPQLVVDRPRLTARLDQGAPLTLLQAPVGFGKTTLAAQWVRAQVEAESPETFVWLRIRPRAGDAASFWPEALDVLGDSGVPIPSRGVSADPARQVERALEQADRSVVMIVDSFERVSDLGIGPSLLDLARHIPHLRLVLCLRGDRQLAEYDYLDLDVTLVGAPDLRFTLDETEDLLRLAGTNVSGAVLRDLYAESRGWPEPTRALALRARGLPTLSQDDLPTLVEGIASDYLRNRLLTETHSTGRIDFALATAVADEFTADLAVALTDPRSAKAHLDALAGDGILITQVHRGDVVYRWPSGARHALVEELRQQHPDLVPTLRSRLARWHHERGDASVALRYAMSAHDWPLVVSIIESSWRVLITKGDQVLSDVVLAVPLEHTARSLRMLALRDRSLRTPDDLLTAAAILPDDPEALERLGQGPDAVDVLDTCLAVTIALRWRGSYDLARCYGERACRIVDAAWRSNAPEVRGVYASLYLQVGLAQLLSGDVSASLNSLREAYDHGGGPRSLVQGDAAGKLALVHSAFGDQMVASTWLRRFAELPRDSSNPAAPLVDSTAAAADLLIAVNHLDLDRAATVDEQLADPVRHNEFWAFVFHARAQYALHARTAADLLGALDIGRTTYASRLQQDTLAGALLAATEVDLLLSLGRGTLARAVLTGPHADHPLLRVGQARLHLLAGEDELALGLTVDGVWERTASQRDRAAMLLIRAVAADRLGEAEMANDALARAVNEAAAGRSWRSFLTVPTIDLERVVRRSDHARAVLSDSPVGRHAALFPSAVTLVRLTEREQQVLLDLADGLSVPEICEKDVLSYNTVRTQQRSLYKKLGTSSKLAAIARARELGLLPPRG